MNKEKMKRTILLSAILFISLFFGTSSIMAESIIFKQAKVRIILPTNWENEYIEDEMIATPPDSDFKLVFVTTAFKSLESAYRDASLGFEKITEKREFEINGMKAIFFRAKDVYDVNEEFRTFDWLYVLFVSPSGYVVSMCGGADARSDVFFKYYIDINMIYKTFKPTVITKTKDTEKPEKKKKK